MPSLMTDAALARADKLTIELQHGGPIPLSDFTAALQRLAGRYAREAKAAGDGEEPKLYIAEIRKGSVVVDLVTAAQALGPPLALAGVAAASDLNTLYSFGKNLAALIRHFTGKETKQGITKADCDDMRALAAPVMNTLDGSLSVQQNFGTINQVVVNLSQDDARVADNRAALERVELSKQEENIHESVLLVWDQVRDAPGVEAGRSPDRGIIAAIDSKPRQVTFASDDLKAAMGRRMHHPFEKAFVVDVRVLLGPSGVAGYRVLRLLDVIDRDDEAP